MRILFPMYRLTFQVPWRSVMSQFCHHLKSSFYVIFLSSKSMNRNFKYKNLRVSNLCIKCWWNWRKIGQIVNKLNCRSFVWQLWQRSRMLIEAFALISQRINWRFDQTVNTKALRNNFFSAKPYRFQLVSNDLFNVQKLVVFVKKKLFILT
jgi:hypothetical protein